MNRQRGIAFIADSRVCRARSPTRRVTTSGDMGHKGTDIKLLMRGDGSGFYRSPSSWHSTSGRRFLKRQPRFALHALPP